MWEKTKIFCSVSITIKFHQESGGKNPETKKRVSEHASHFPSPLPRPGSSFYNLSYL